MTSCPRVRGRHRDHDVADHLVRHLGGVPVVSRVDRQLDDRPVVEVLDGRCLADAQLCRDLRHLPADDRPGRPSSGAIPCSTGVACRIRARPRTAARTPELVSRGRTAPARAGIGGTFRRSWLSSGPSLGRQPLVRSGEAESGLEAKAQLRRGAGRPPLLDHARCRQCQGLRRGEQRRCSANAIGVDDDGCHVPATSDVPHAR
jgi:hypothetical protein